MALLICAATSGELCALAPGLLKRLNTVPELQPFKIGIKTGEAIFLATGVGPINTALAMGHCFGLTHESTRSETRIDAVLYAGLAGAFDLDRNPLCTSWRVEREIWPEYGLNDGFRVTARAFSHPLWTRDNGETVYDELTLANLDVLPGAKFKQDAFPACTSLTVAGVSASFSRRQTLWDTWHADLENMEGFAAAYVAARAGVPLVEIRVVSNKVGPRAQHEKDFDGALKALGNILPDLNLV